MTITTTTDDNDIRDRITDLETRANQLLDRAETEHRDLTDNESSEVSDLSSQISRYRQSLDYRSREREMDERRTAAGDLGRRAPTNAGIETRNSPDGLAALRAGDKTTIDVNLAPVMDAYIERRTAIAHGLETRALGTSGFATATAGAELVDDLFHRTTVRRLFATSPLRRAGCRIISTRSGQDLTVPRFDAPADSVTVAEGATIPEDDMALSNITISVTKRGHLFHTTYELEQDLTVSDFATLIGEQAGLSIARAEGPALSTGTTGYITQSTIGVTAASTTVFTDAEIEDLFFAMAPEYRESAVWLASDAAIKVIRGFRDADQRPLIDRDRALADVGAPGRLMGLPLYTDPHHNALTTGNKVLTLLEPSRYWIRQTMPFMRIDRSTQPKFEKDMISYRILAASGGALVDPGAAVSLELA